MRKRIGTALGVLGVGCSQLIGADEYAVEDHGPHAGLLSFASEACSECVEASCAELLSVCETSKPCAQLGRCFAEMPGPQHRATCQGRFPEMAALHTELGRCMGRSCSAECGGGSDWSCLGAEAETAQPVDSDFELRLKLTEIITLAPAQGMAVKVCERVGWTDTECDASLQRVGTTDDDGRVAFRIPFRTLGIRQAWDGYLLVDGPDYYPDLRLFTQPLAADIDVMATAISIATQQKIASAYDVEQDPARGMISATLFDCVGIPAPGVRFELEADSATERFYSKGAGLLSRSASVTSPDGIVLFTNVASGRHLLRAYVGATGARVGEYDLWVAPGRRTVILAEAN